MTQITIEILQKLCSDLDSIKITQHTFVRFQERGILIRDVINTINTGEIIEYYPDDYPYPSCLVLGLSVENDYLHVCCGIGNDKIWIITAYYPAEDKWENDFKTRKVMS